MTTPPLPAADLEHVLDHTRSLWDDLRGERIFITGGTGFFGIWLLETFAHANDRLGLGAQAVVLTRDPAAAARRIPQLVRRTDMTLLAGDVRNFSFPTGTFSHIIHAAGESSVHFEPSQKMTMLGIITDGTRHTLDFALRAGTKKFLFTSSGAAYGRQPAGIQRIDEERTSDWSLPESPDFADLYREGKRNAELFCNLAHAADGPNTKIARCFAFVGPHLPLEAQFAVGNFIRDALRGGPIRVNSDGTAQRSYLYAADLAIWLWTILFRGRPQHPYNVGSEEAFTIADIARLVSESVPARPEVHIAVKAQPNGQANRYVPSTGRARQELGLEAWIDIREALRRTLAWISHKGDY